ncbi:hypothetical protein ANOM_003171 [Aspergillus nomiae NRRL 13137]|uniref:Dolichyl-diphosphooligosaccharide--protein glycosyltransferase subunit 4 n=1 Tax=Aspergillus nomiae NRRL (strain ATCC 15546 / NRRL 13137 / CBS 260.88 / M93) TaxID=1509407 RepID=A0A0L1JCY3_ASPN3|nr:uncharacterized protein ANOM_003171 [Aspergillus nomiae NRRL 13137]KNG89572.1 hypothetical protein ANOM_003171 [Aspergillus nomiae NRRL 13137]
MISDDDLHRLAVFLGSCAMMMIVLYHFLEVNAKDTGVEGASEGKKPAAASQESVAASPSTEPAAVAGDILLVAHSLIPGGSSQLTSAGIQPNTNLFFEPLDRLEDSLGLVTLCIMPMHEIKCSD